MDLCSRIKYICEREGVSVASLNAAIGAGRDMLGKFMREGRGSLQSEWLVAILRLYPAYDPGWLLTGEGSPVRIVAQARGSEKDGVVMVEPGDVSILGEGKASGLILKPHYCVDFLSGFREGFERDVVAFDELICFPAFRTADFWVDISGRSMEPCISHGDVIAVRKLGDWRQHILYGEMYVVVTDENRTLKRIRRSSLEGHLLLVPDNPAYDPQDIPVDIIREVYKVLACVKKVF